MNIKKDINKLKKKIFQLNKNRILFNYHKNLDIDEKLILLESKNGHDIAANIFYLLKELSKERYSEYTIILALEKKLFKSKKKLLNKYKIFNVKFTEIGSLKYYKYLYTAKYLFSDSTFPFTYMKKEGQIYLNTWHGTPLKKLGKANFKRAYGLGNVQRNFIMADYLLYSNPFMEKIMIDSFMLENLSSAKIINEGYPRNDVFFKKNLDDENNTNKNDNTEYINEYNLKSKLNLDDKEIIVYMPTWRGTYDNLDTKSQNDKIKRYLSKIDNSLSSNQILFVKLHHIVDDEINYNHYDKIQKFPEDFETYEILNLADCLITDYSSVFFDFACSKKKIILFVYDEEEYLDSVGIYFPLKELPFPKVYDVEELIKEINTEKNYQDEEFLDKFCKYNRADSVKYLCEYIILNEKNKIKIKEIGSNNKKNVLIYVGSLKNNDIRKKLMKLLKNLDLNERNYFLTMKASEAKKNKSILFELSQFLPYIPMKDELTLDFNDFISFKLFFKYNISNKIVNKQLNKCYEKNINKYFPKIHFDYVIHFTGFNNQLLNLFERFKSKKTVFIHENIYKKIKKGKVHELSLKNAYEKYDIVFISQKKLLKYKLKISPKKDNLILSDFNNFKEFLKDFESIFKQ